MKKLYEKLIGERKIKDHKKDWELFQKEIIKEFNWYILIIVISIIAYFIFPQFKVYIGIALYPLFAFLILKFGEYKGYNECLYDLENDFEETNE